MQHILNVAFEFDDKKVKETLEKTAEKKVLDMLLHDVASVIRTENFTSYRNYYSNKNDETFVDHETLVCLNNKINSAIKESVDKVVSDNKEEIINKAAEIIAGRMLRTKALKDEVNKL